MFVDYVFVNVFLAYKCFYDYVQLKWVFIGEN